jgi:hypothetical protein
VNDRGKVNSNEDDRNKVWKRKFGDFKKGELKLAIWSENQEQFPHFDLRLCFYKDGKDPRL